MMLSRPTTFDQTFLDRYGFVLPQPSSEGKPADNAVLFTAVAHIFGFEIAPNIILKIRQCELKPGLIARWPNNNFDQATWDDYLAIAVLSIVKGEKKLPRDILWYGATHWGIFNTDDKLQFQDLLIRHVHVWPMMVTAAYPWMKFITHPMIRFFTRFFNKPNLNDTSSIQLQWLYLYGALMSGVEGLNQKYIEHVEILPQAFKVYYHKEHPFNQMRIGVAEL
jgi:hypothetical protein